MTCGEEVLGCNLLTHVLWQQLLCMVPQSLNGSEVVDQNYAVQHCHTATEAGEGKWDNTACHCCSKLCSNAMWGNLQSKLPDEHMALTADLSCMLSHLRDSNLSAFTALA